MDIKTAQTWLTRKKNTLSLRQMAKAMDVDYWWLVKFAAQKINNPGYERMVKIAKYIESQSL